jgi:hypothetical protein
MAYVHVVDVQKFRLRAASLCRKDIAKVSLKIDMSNSSDTVEGRRDCKHNTLTLIPDELEYRPYTDFAGKPGSNPKITRPAHAAMADELECHNGRPIMPG